MKREHRPSTGGSKREGAPWGIILQLVIGEGEATSMKIAILTGGGVAPGMNAAVRAVA
jgi:hypothetical protein